MELFGAMKSELMYQFWHCYLAKKLEIVTRAFHLHLEAQGVSVKQGGAAATGLLGLLALLYLPSSWERRRREERGKEKGGEVVDYLYWLKT